VIRFSVVEESDVMWKKGCVHCCSPGWRGGVKVGKAVDGMTQERDVGIDLLCVFLLNREKALGESREG
jgi:hypothetical protein